MISSIRSCVFNGTKIYSVMILSSFRSALAH